MHFPTFLAKCLEFELPAERWSWKNGYGIVNIFAKSVGTLVNQGRSSIFGGLGGVSFMTHLPCPAAALSTICQFC